MSDDSTVRSCSCCHRSQSITGKKLKRCSRCHRAYYCGADCQREHFSVHKKDCKRWATERNSKEKSGSNDSKSLATISGPDNKFLVQKREGRGNCLVVAPGSTIRKGEKIRDTNREYWEPLILPVLHEEHRTSRCALCFGPLAPESFSSFDHLPPNPLYRLHFCSSNCRKVASDNGLAQEEKDCYSFAQNLRGQGPKRIFSTAIMLYRILVREQRNQGNDATICDQVRELQGRPNRASSSTIETNSEEANGYHTRGVIAIAMGMLQSSNLSISSSYRPSMEYLSEMVHRIKVNGFSIYSESHFENFGFGLYDTPSFMNHSCRANTLQSFVFRPSNPPSLCLAAFRDIQANEEICISYIDASSPSHLRQNKLEINYYFRCTCKACDINSGKQDDCWTMALRCCNGCKKASSPVILADKGLAPTRQIFECSECHSTDFDDSLRQLERLQENDSGRFPNYTRVKDLEATYTDSKRLCYTSSWYVQEAGEILLQNYLDKLPSFVNDPLLEQQTARKALKLADELVGSPTNGSTSAFLRHQHLKHKAAKLRLFLVPDPRQSIRELREVLGSLEPYFPTNHAVIAQVKASLASAMM